jgi:hypothetical protein
MADDKLTGKTAPGKVLSDGGPLFGESCRRMGLKLDTWIVVESSADLIFIKKD